MEGYNFDVVESYIENFLTHTPEQISKIFKDLDNVLHDQYPISLCSHSQLFFYFDIMAGYIFFFRIY